MTGPLRPRPGACSRNTAQRLGVPSLMQSVCEPALGNRIIPSLSPIILLHASLFPGSLIAVSLPIPIVLQLFGAHIGKANTFPSSSAWIGLLYPARAPLPRFVLYTTFRSPPFLQPRKVKGSFLPFAGGRVLKHVFLLWLLIFYL